VNRFEGRVVLITGASRGIGFAVAQRVVAEGGQVVITGRKQPGLDAALAELGNAASAVAGRADDAEHRAATYAHIAERYGRLDHLVNNTGINPAYGPTLDIDPAAAAKILGVNVLAPLGWTKRARDAWMGEHGGAVVNVASVAGLGASPGIGMYGVSKAALIRLTKELGFELGPKIRVNAVAPAVVKTKFATALYEGREEEVSESYPMKRLGVPADIAGAVSFLLSEEAGWITGQTVVLDGGVTLAGGL